MKIYPLLGVEFSGGWAEAFFLRLRGLKMDAEAAFGSDLQLAEGFFGQRKFLTTIKPGYERILNSGRCGVYASLHGL